MSQSQNSLDREARAQDNAHAVAPQAKSTKGPVYVECVGTDDERIVYNSTDMELGKKYHVTWLKRHIILKKTDDSVKLYELEDDK